MDIDKENLEKIRECLDASDEVKRKSIDCLYDRFHKNKYGEADGKNDKHEPHDTSVYLVFGYDRLAPIIEREDDGLEPEQCILDLLKAVIYPGKGEFSRLTQHMFNCKFYLSLVFVTELRLYCYLLVDERKLLVL